MGRYLDLDDVAATSDLAMQELVEMRAEIARLRAELDAVTMELAIAVQNGESARVDAERYRWLRDKIENQDFVIAKEGSWSLESWSGDNPDAAIEAARGGK